MHHFGGTFGGTLFLLNNLFTLYQHLIKLVCCRVGAPFSYPLQPNKVEKTLIYRGFIITVCPKQYYTVGAHPA